jgi:hypothetical protein
MKSKRLCFSVLYRVAADARAIEPSHIAFHIIKHVGLQVEDFSRLNGWPMRSPVNAA